MNYTYPHTISNGGKEQITFVRKVQDGDTEYLEVENLVSPGGGPPMHTHFKQDESLTVVQGRIGVLVKGKEPAYYGPGETVTFTAGIPHKFWNAGEDQLICKGWIKPAHNVEYFLTEIYRSTEANGGERPGNFDSAYLATKYRTEFAIDEVPALVQKVVFPPTVWLGKLLGKHKKYADAPPPVL